MRFFQHCLHPGRSGAVTSVGRMWVSEHEGSPLHCESFWDPLAWLGNTSCLGVGNLVLRAVSAHVCVAGLEGLCGVLMSSGPGVAAL